MSATSKRIRWVDLVFAGTNVRYFSPSEISTLDIPLKQRTVLIRVLSVLNRYRDTRHNLATGKYLSYSDAVPQYYRERHLMTVLCCSDGILIRHEKNDVDAIAGAWSDKSLRELAPLISERVVYFSGYDEDVPLDISAPSIELFIQGPDGARRDIAKLSPQVIAYSDGRHAIQRHDHPFKLVDMNSTFEIVLNGVEVDTNAPLDTTDGTAFIARTPIELGVAWHRFEVYGAYDEKKWLEEAADGWAENDILNEITSYNAHRDKFLALDPMFSARKHYITLMQRFDKVLAEAEREEDMQQFITAYPSFLDPTHSKVWPKLALGKHVTDFVIRLKTGEYVLIELEHPKKKLFNKTGAPSAHLTQAIDQTTDWVRYIEDNLATVQRELGLSDITPHPKRVVVIGRSSDLSEENRRKLKTLSGQSPLIRILTYDDLRLQTEQALENIVGPLREQPGDTELYFPIAGVGQI